MYMQQQQPPQNQQQPLAQGPHVSSNSPTMGHHMPQSTLSAGTNFQFANMGGGTAAMPHQQFTSPSGQPNFVPGQMLSTAPAQASNPQQNFPAGIPVQMGYAATNPTQPASMYFTVAAAAQPPPSSLRNSFNGAMPSGACSSVVGAGPPFSQSANGQLGGLASSSASHPSQAQKVNKQLLQLQQQQIIRPPTNDQRMQQYHHQQHPQHQATIQATSFSSDHYPQVRGSMHVDQHNHNLHMDTSHNHAIFSAQSIDSSLHNNRSSLGIMGSPGTNSLKVSANLSSSIGAYHGGSSQNNRTLARTKQVNSSTTGDSNGNERRSSLRSPEQFKNISQLTGGGNWMPHTEGSQTRLTSTTKKEEFQQIKKYWDPITPQRQKLSLSPTTLENAERNMTSPMVANNMQHYGAYGQQLGGTVVQNERKHFVRKRVNTKTPNRKSNSVIISTANMQWPCALKLTDIVFKLLPQDQIKSCNMENDKSQIKVQLANYEAAQKVIEHLNNKVVMDEKVTVYQDLTATSKYVSPKTGTDQTSSSPQQAVPPQQQSTSHNQAANSSTAGLMSNNSNSFVLPNSGAQGSQQQQMLLTPEQLMQMQNMVIQQNGQYLSYPGHQPHQFMHNDQLQTRQTDFYRGFAAAGGAGHEAGGAQETIQRRQQVDQSPIGGENATLFNTLDHQAQQQQQALEPHFCHCCQNGHQNLQKQQSQSNQSVSTPTEPFHPSGGSSGQESISYINGLNRSPIMVRTLEHSMHGTGPLNINNMVQSTGSEQIYRSGAVGGLDVMCRHYNSQNQFSNHGFNYQTPNSNHAKSSNNTKSANGSQNASSHHSKSTNQTRYNEPVKIDLVKQGLDLRTYLCVKNIPCRYTKKELKDEINQNHKGRYSALDIIEDKKEPKKMTNMGYFFIDFKNPLFVVDFYNEYQGKTWELHNSDKKVGVYYGRNPKKECPPINKLDTNLVNELHRIIEKYGISVPLENFQRHATPCGGAASNSNQQQTQLQSKSHVAGFSSASAASQAQYMAQIDQVQKSLSQVHLSNPEFHQQPQEQQMQLNHNSTIAEEEKEQDANDMSDQKIIQKETTNTTQQ